MAASSHPSRPCSSNCSCWKRSTRAVVDLAERVAAARISCGWRSRSVLYLLGDRTDANHLAKEAEARRRIGLPSELIERDVLRRDYGIDRPLAIRSLGCAEADPVRLAAGLLRRALQRGARLYAPVEITRVDASPQGILARSKTGFHIAAASLIYATGYEVPHPVPSPGHRVVSRRSRPLRRDDVRRKPLAPPA